VVHKQRDRALRPRDQRLDALEPRPHDCRRPAQTGRRLPDLVVEYPALPRQTLVFDSGTQQWTTYTWEPNGPPGQVVGMPGLDCVDDSGNLWALRTNAPGDWNSLDYRQPDGAWSRRPNPTRLSRLACGRSRPMAIGVRSRSTARERCTSSMA